MMDVRPHVRLADGDGGGRADRSKEKFSRCRDRLLTAVDEVQTPTVADVDLF